MSEGTRREFLKTLLSGLLSATGSVVLARSEVEAANDGRLAGSELGENGEQVNAKVNERADALASANGGAENMDDLTPIGFRRAGFANGGFRNAGFRRGGFANGGFHNGGFRNGSFRR